MSRLNDFYIPTLTIRLAEEKTKLRNTFTSELYITDTSC